MPAEQEPIAPDRRTEHWSAPSYGIFQWSSGRRSRMVCVESGNDCMISSAPTAQGAGPAFPKIRFRTGWTSRTPAWGALPKRPVRPPVRQQLSRKTSSPWRVTAAPMLRVITWPSR